MFTEADIGLKVYSLEFGRGVIFDYLIYDMISVYFGDHYQSYTLDGRFTPNDVTQDLYFAKPEIIAPPRPKKKVTKVVERWVNVYSSKPKFITTYLTEELANNNIGINRIACVKLTGSYEVEE